MENVHYYEVSVSWENGRIGKLSSPALDDTITVATPPEFNNGIPRIWSPEHLLVAAVNSCLMTTFLAIADNFKLPFEDFSSSAIGKLEVVEGKYMISEITLKPVLTIQNDEDKDKALKVLNKSEAACLISNSVRAKITLDPYIQTQKNLIAK